MSPWSNERLESLAGHQFQRPISMAIEGTRSVRTKNVSR
jgi:hypothetical protein